MQHPPHALHNIPHPFPQQQQQQTIGMQMPMPMPMPTPNPPLQQPIMTGPGGIPPQPPPGATAPINKPPVPSPPSTLVDQRNGKTYVKGPVLGQGGFAKCYQVTDQSGHIFAAKVVSKASLKAPKHMQKLLAEIKIHRQMTHRHIVKFHDNFEDKDFVYLILDMCECKSLMDMLRKRKRITEAETRFFMVQILHAVQYMHKCHVIHRDLKLGNLFLAKDLQVKVGDFGLATYVKHEGERKKTICGTPNYIAPEILFDTKNGHSYEVDIWSVGVIMYTMLIGKPPFQTKDIKAIYRRIKDNQYEFPAHSPIGEDAKDLITQLLKTKPESRPMVDQIMLHPFFENVSPKLEWLPHEALVQEPEITPEMLRPRNGGVSLMSPNVSATSQRSKKSAIQESTASAMVQQSIPPSPANHPSPTQSHQALAPGSYQKVAPAPLKPIMPPAAAPAAAAASYRSKHAPHVSQASKQRDLSPVSAQLPPESARMPSHAPPAQAVSQAPSLAPVAASHASMQSAAAQPQAEAQPQASDPSSKENSVVPNAVPQPEPQHQQGQEHSGATGHSAGGAMPANGSRRSLPSSEEVEVDKTGAGMLENVYMTLESHFTRLKQNQLTLPKNSSGIQYTPPTVPKVFISKWIDYSNRYGLGYELTNGCFGVYFNDSTSLVLAPDEVHFEHLYFTKHRLSMKRQYYRLDGTYPADLNKKVTLLKHFKGYMQENLYKAQYSYQDPGVVKNLDFLTKYVRTKSAVLFRLSNQILQINFFDHTKIVLSDMGKTITYINQKRELETRELSKFLLEGPKDGVSRLKYSRDVLMHLYQRRKESSKSGQSQDTGVISSPNSVAERG